MAIALCLSLGLKSIVPAYAATIPTITEFDLASASQPTGDSELNITTGPDGNLWATNAYGYIQKITPDGTMTAYALPNGYKPSAVTTGPDGNVWFTLPFGSENAIGKITPSGVITIYTIPSAAPPNGSTDPTSIALGPDGNLWFTEYLGNKIGKITPSGVITEYPLPTDPSLPNDIVAGTDGSLWFTEYGNSKIGKITPSGVVNEFPLPAGYTQPYSIASGSDGNIWFNDINYTDPTVNGDDTSDIAKITPSGVITEYSTPNPDSVSAPYYITSGPDGKLWFTESNNNSLYSMTTSGTITEYPLPPSASSNNSQAYDVTAGPDRNVWFTAEVSGSPAYVGRINISDLKTISANTGFKPNPDGFGFDNYNDQTPLSKASFEQYFGKAATTYSTGKKKGELTSAALAYYNKNYKIAASSGGGYCVGFTGASGINYEKLGQTHAGNFALPEKSTLYGIKSITTIPKGSSDTMQQILGYYQGVQTGSEIQAIYHTNPSPGMNLYAIEKSIQIGKPIAVSIQKLVKKTIPGLIYYEPEGHVLLAYRYVSAPGDTIHVYVYDSNHKGNNYEYITFNLDNDSWEYNPKYDKTGPWGSEVTGSKMQTIPISIFTEKGVMPSSSTTSSTIIAPTGDTYISDSTGANTGTMDGQLEYQANGITMLPSMDDGSTDTPPNQQFVTTIGNTYTVHVTNDGTQPPTPIDIFGNNAYLSVSGLTPLVNDTAAITLGTDGKSVTVSASAKVTNYSVTLDQEVTGKSLVFTVGGLSLNPGETTILSLITDNGQLQISNKGTAKTYSVSMQENGGNDSTLTQSNVSIGNKMTQTFVPTDWDNLESSTVNFNTTNM